MREIFVQELTPGLVVILDNLSAYKAAEADASIACSTCRRNRLM
jgi:hypothetical protein